MKIVSWNVNGFRASVKKGFYEFLEKENPDVLCLQEIKSHEIPTFPLGFQYKVLWNPAKKKGYSGTAVFSKIPIRSYTHGLGEEKFDSEGRVTTVEFEDFFLINTYFPNSQRELTRLDFKLEFNELLLKHLEQLKKRKPVVLCGDLNVAHEEIDIARPKDNKKNAGFTQAERDWMTKLLSAGYIDTFRHMHPEDTAYTWWTYRFNARSRNIGWRIDYFVVSNKFTSRIEKASVLTDVMGSDHAPVLIEVKDD
ncbi:MAG: exodeoxyribonuclease III [Candidatus Altiarchaeota archaeon]|nr:exodeoxyribonuclease III [Candidatus Altiarchaeota archaeon]